MSCAPASASCVHAWRSSCSRGKVDCTITYRRTQAPGATLEIDAAALERVLAAVRGVRRALPEPATLNALDVLRWPGVLREDSSPGEQLLTIALALFAQTLEELVATRFREGARLRELIEQRCSGLEILVDRCRARLPEVQARVRARLDERLAELQANVDQERLEQELAILLQRLDVDEELDRLSGHIEEIRRVIGGQRACRAAPRLPHAGAQPRSQHAVFEVAGSRDHPRAVDMKVIIEQMREQVQNVE